MTQKYQFAHAGKSMFLGDLPVAKVAAIAVEYDKPWYVVCDAPIGDLRVMASLAEAAAAHLGIALPDPLTVSDLFAMFTVAEDDLPEQFNTPEGGIPAPLADGPATT